MLDIQLLRNHLDAVVARLASRGLALDTTEFLALEAERKDLQTRTQDLQARRNSLSKQIGQLKARGEDSASVMQQVAGLGDALKQDEERLVVLLERLNALIANLPNLPHESVPPGDSDADNVEIKRWGLPRSFDFAVRTMSTSAQPWAGWTSRSR